MSNLKDLDFERFEQRVHAAPELSQRLIEVMRKDAAFLASQNLIDYSLALYIVDKGSFKGSSIYMTQSLLVTDEGLNTSTGSTGSAGSQGSMRGNEDTLTSMRSTQEDLYYHLGIIDYLIPFNCRKKLEVFSRKLLACNPRHNISVQRPAFYSERFVKFMERIFAPEDSQSRASTETTFGNKHL